MKANDGAVSSGEGVDDMPVEDREAWRAARWKSLAPPIWSHPQFISDGILWQAMSLQPSESLTAWKVGLLTVYLTSMVSSWFITDSCIWQNFACFFQILSRNRLLRRNIPMAFSRSRRSSFSLLYSCHAIRIQKWLIDFLDILMFNAVLKISSLLWIQDWQ